jgi:hypothetical protein
MDKMKGVIFQKEVDDYSQVEAQVELEKLVKDCLLILRIEGQEQPYCFDLTHDVDLRNYILARLTDEKVLEEN